MDDLEVDHEVDLVDIVRQYFVGREELTKNQELSPEQAVKKELWDLLNDNERK